MSCELQVVCFHRHSYSLLPPSPHTCTLRPHERPPRDPLAEKSGKRQERSFAVKKNITKVKERVGRWRREEREGGRREGLTSSMFMKGKFKGSRFQYKLLASQMCVMERARGAS